MLCTFGQMSLFYVIHVYTSVAISWHVFVAGKTLVIGITFSKKICRVCCFHFHSNMAQWSLYQKNFEDLTRVIYVSTIC